MAGRNDLAVDRQSDPAILAGDAKVIPFRPRFDARFGGKRPTAASTIVRFHRRAVNRENVAIGRMILRFAGIQFENLDFDATMKRDAARRKIIGPDKNPRISFGNKVPPFEFQDKVLEHFLRANFTIRLTGTHEQSALHGPRFFRSVRAHPTVEIRAVEQRFEVGGGRGEGKQRREEVPEERFRIHGNVPADWSVFFEP